MAVGVTVGVAVGLAVGLAVGVGVAVGLAVAVGVAVGVGVGVTVGVVPSVNIALSTYIVVLTGFELNMIYTIPVPFAVLVATVVNVFEL